MLKLLLALTLLMTPGLASAEDSPDVELARAAYRFGFPVYQMMFQRGQGEASAADGGRGLLRGGSRRGQGVADQQDQEQTRDEVQPEHDHGADPDPPPV